MGLEGALSPGATGCAAWGLRVKARARLGLFPARARLGLFPTRAEKQSYLGCSGHLRMPGNEGEESQQLRCPLLAWTTSPSIWTIPCHSLKWDKAPRAGAGLPHASVGTPGPQKEPSVWRSRQRPGLVPPASAAPPKGALKSSSGGLGAGWGLQGEAGGLEAQRPRGTPLLFLLLQ